MIRSASGPDMPNLVEIGSRGSSGEMFVFRTIIFLKISTQLNITLDQKLFCSCVDIVDLEVTFTEDTINSF